MNAYLEIYNKSQQADWMNDLRVKEDNWQKSL